MRVGFARAVLNNSIGFSDSMVDEAAQTVIKSWKGGEENGCQEASERSFTQEGD
jgi:hypothetical protein